MDANQNQPNNLELMAKIMPYISSLRGKARADYMAHLVQKNKAIAALVGEELKRLRVQTKPNWQIAKAEFLDGGYLKMAMGDGLYKGYLYQKNKNGYVILNPESQEAGAVSLVEGKETGDMSTAEVANIFSSPVQEKLLINGPRYGY